MNNNETYSTNHSFFYLKSARRNHSAPVYGINLPSSLIVAILSPVAVVGNSLVLEAIWRRPSLRTPCYILLTGLASTDVCTELISQPIYVAKHLMYMLDNKLNAVESRASFIVIIASSNCCATFFSNVTVTVAHDS